MLREDTWSVRVAVAGQDLGIWDKFEGGEVDSEDTTYRPGGLGEQIPLGGARTVGNVTVTRIYDPTIDLAFHGLAQTAGGAEMVVSRQPLDLDGSPIGRVAVWSGILKRVQAPEIDSMGNDASQIELEMTCKGNVT